MAPPTWRGETHKGLIHPACDLQSVRCQRSSPAPSESRASPRALLITCTLQTCPEGAETGWKEAARCKPSAPAVSPARFARSKGATKLKRTNKNNFTPTFGMHGQSLPSGNSPAWEGGCAQIAPSCAIWEQQSQHPGLCPIRRPFLPAALCEPLPPEHGEAPREPFTAISSSSSSGSPPPFPPPSLFFFPPFLKCFGSCSASPPPPAPRCQLQGQGAQCGVPILPLPHEV